MSSGAGFDLKSNDVRFVEDDWENPTLGCWGLGWEVWLNGMEVTQFTYFQQVGGIDCRPITGEITYGLERLAMYLQGVDNVYKLQWTDGLTYGDVYLQNEQEQSAYNFEHSDVAFLLGAFAAHEKQAQHLMAEKLALPAYEQVLKAAHTFNLLDARGEALQQPGGEGVAEPAQRLRRQLLDEQLDEQVALHVVRHHAAFFCARWASTSSAQSFGAIGKPSRARLSR